MDVKNKLEIDSTGIWNWLRQVEESIPSILSPNKFFIGKLEENWFGARNNDLNFEVIEQ